MIHFRPVFMAWDHTLTHLLFRRVIIVRGKVFMRSESPSLDVEYVVGNSTIFNPV